MKQVLKCVAAGVLALSASAAMAGAPYADVVVLMDESGSMSGEQAWIVGTIPLLEAGLTSPTYGLTPNRYGLIGFGASAASDPLDVRGFSVGGGQFGTSAQFVTAGGGLVSSGSYEDGYAAINLGASYSFRADAARNFILVSDEDRDNDRTQSSAFNYANTLSTMQSKGIVLNAVISGTFKCGDGSAALGIIGSTGYKADGAGGFTTCTGGSFVSGFGTTGADYVNLALATGGGAWNLDLIDAGGLNLQSFTKAFVAGKVEEISTQPPPIPEPSTYALMLAGLGAVGWVARRRKQA